MISVIIPTHHRPDLLDETLVHLFDQKDVDLEVFVINDDEHDLATDAVVEKYPGIKYIKDGSFDGPAEKRKYGLKVATGDFLYTTDDDDYLIDNSFLSKAEKILKDDSSLSFVSGNTLMYYENMNDGTVRTEERILPIVGRQNQWEYMQQFNHAKPQSVAPTLFRTAAFKQFPRKLMYDTCDTGIYLIALLYGDAYILSDVVSIFRFRSDLSSTSFNSPIKYMFDGLRQREAIYNKAKNHLVNPRHFLALTYITSCNWYWGSNPNAWKKCRVMLWMLFHGHGSKRIIKYVLKNLMPSSLKRNQTC